MKKWKYSKNIGQNAPEEKKQSFWKNKKALVLAMGLGFIFLMVGSMLTYWLYNDESDQLEYNGHFFYLSNQGWVTKINGQQASFEQSPKDLEGIAAEPFSIPEGKVYVAFNPEERGEDSYEIQRIRSFLIFTGKTASAACTQEEACSDIPIVDCENSGRVIYLKEAENTRITREGNCIVLEAGSGRELEVSNLFLYKYLGVM